MLVHTERGVAQPPLQSEIRQCHSSYEEVTQVLKLIGVSEFVPNDVRGELCVMQC
jgi:hypothetical protein